MEGTKSDTWARVGSDSSAVYRNEIAALRARVNELEVVKSLLSAAVVIIDCQAHPATELVARHVANLESRASRAEAERDEARARVEKLSALVRCLVDEDPAEQIDDRGSTVLDMWRHDARAALAECGEG